MRQEGRTMGQDGSHQRKRHGSLIGETALRPPGTIQNQKWNLIQ